MKLDGRGKWGVVVAASAGSGLGLSGLPFFTAGVFAGPLHRVFGWSIAQIQGGLTLTLLTNMVTLPIAAWLARRFGARPIALVSVLLFPLSFALLAGQTGEIIQFYLNCILLSCAGAGTLGVIWTQAISTWFSHRRGAALGLTMMGTGVTGLVAPILANTLIDAFGWRAAYVILGATPLMLAAPLVYLLFWEQPRAQCGDEAIGQGRLVGTIVKDRRFWVIGAAFLLIGWTVAGIIPNFITLLTGAGYTAAQAAQMASLVGLFVILGRLGCGLLLDRLWAPASATIFFALAAGGCLLLAKSQLGPVFAVLSASAIGLAAGAEFDVLPYLAGRDFKSERIGTALALMSIFFYFGAALGPWSFRFLHDFTGRYSTALFLGAFFLCLGSCALLSLGRYHFESAAGEIPILSAPST